MRPSDVISVTKDQMVRIGSAFYFRPETVTVAKDHGLNGMNFYVAGRGGVLGNVDAVTVRSAFGYFHPAVIAKLWNSAAAVMKPTAISELFLGCAHQAGRDLFSSIDAGLLNGFIEAASEVIAVPEGAAMALFSSLREQPVPDDIPAAAMHQAMVLRELRGDVHLVSVVSAGLPTEVAHAINRPNDVEMFGWSDPIVPTDAQREAWHRAESTTDALLEPAYAVLTDQAADAYVAGSAAMFDALPG